MSYLWSGKVEGNPFCRYTNLLSFSTKWGGSAAGEVEHCIRTSESESWLSEDAISAQSGILHGNKERQIYDEEKLYTNEVPKLSIFSSDTCVQRLFPTTILYFITRTPDTAKQKCNFAVPNAIKMCDWMINKNVDKATTELFMWRGTKQRGTAIVRTSIQHCSMALREAFATPPPLFSQTVVMYPYYLSCGI